MKAFFTKLMLIGLVCLSLIQYGKAQYRVNGKQIDTTFNTQMNRVFGGLDKSRVPFGLLKDYALELTNLQGYNGNDMADSTLLNKTLLYDIYNTLLTARVTAAAYGTLPNSTVTDSVWYGYRQPGQVVLCGLFYQYAYLDANALNNNAITVSNNQYFDKYVNGSWQNPYLTGKTLGFAPATETYLGQSFNLLLPASLWLSNSKGIVNHIEIDPGDGQGYRTISPDVPLPVSYADTGLKIWNFKLYLSDNTVLQSHTRLKVNEDTYGQNVTDGSNSNNRATRAVKANIGSAQLGLPATGSAGFYAFQSSETYLGKQALGYITVSLAPGHSTIQKPLIIVEGFDVGKYTHPEEPTGSGSITDFVKEVSKSSNLAALLSDGQTATYDLIYIDNDNGTDYIQRNALLVKDVIRWVNSVKQPLSGHTAKEKNVVLGQSMGTLVARYALKKMEDAGETHDVGLYISHDGPQQGANVPMGLQSLVNHADNLYARAGVGAAIYDLICLVFGGNNKIPGELDIRSTPAARQMIINYINNDDNLDNSMHNAWQTELDNLGYPSQGGIRKIAISNGSECAQPAGVTAGGQIMLIDGQFKTSLLTEVLTVVGEAFFPVTTANIYTGLAVASGEPALLLGLVPGGNKITMHFQVNISNLYGGNQDYNGYINYTKKLFWLVNVTISMTNRSINAPSVGLSYDTFPGSYISASITGPAVNTWFYDYHVTVNGPAAFCFIPVPSALDISGNPTNLSPGDYSIPYSENHPPAAPKNTPFDNFITAYIKGAPNNEEHIAFESRNGAWLAKELQATPAVYGCSVLCNSISLNGADHVCDGSPQTYAIAMSAPASQAPEIGYVWTISSNLQYVNGTNLNSQSIQVQANTGAQGTGTISCKVGNNDCGFVTVSQQVFVGVPLCQTIIGNYKHQQDYLNFISFTVPQQDGCTYQWNVNGNVQSSTSAGVIINNPDCNTTSWSIHVTISNSCGSKSIGKSFTLDCPNGKLTPNSSSGYCIDPVLYPDVAMMPVGDMDDNGSNTMVAPGYYPNPANTLITITSRAQNSASNTAYKFQIYDKLGHVVRAGKSTGADTLVTTDDLPSDAYVLRLVINGKIYSKQVIIRH